MRRDLALLSQSQNWEGLGRVENLKLDTISSEVATMPRVSLNKLARRASC